MARKQRIIRIDDFSAHMFRIMRLGDGTWGITVDGVEVDPKGNVIQAVSEYVELSNGKLQAQWETIVPAIEQLVKQKRGLDDGVDATAQAKTAAPKIISKRKRK